VCIALPINKIAEIAEFLPILPICSAFFSLEMIHFFWINYLKTLFLIDLSGFWGFS
jgi:hypothetical protein